MLTLQCPCEWVQTLHHQHYGQRFWPTSFREARKGGGSSPGAQAGASGAHPHPLLQRPLPAGPGISVPVSAMEGGLGARTCPHPLPPPGSTETLPTPSPQPIRGPTHPLLPPSSPVPSLAFPSTTQILSQEKSQTQSPYIPTRVPQGLLWPCLTWPKPLAEPSCADC